MTIKVGIALIAAGAIATASVWTAGAQAAAPAKPGFAIDLSAKDKDKDKKKQGGGQYKKGGGQKSGDQGGGGKKFSGQKKGGSQGGGGNKFSGQKKGGGGKNFSQQKGGGSAYIRGRNFSTWRGGGYRVRHHGYWRTFVPVSALAFIVIGSRQYYPYAYLSAPEDFCEGLTEDGCYLRWREVETIEGDVIGQCVAYCPWQD
jgi:hypothetical protein